MEFIFVIFVIVAIAAAIFSAIAASKRRDALSQLAARLGLQFRSDDDYHLADRFEFLDKLAQGSNRYAFNILQGTYREREVCVFDFHYETHSTDSKGRRQTHHHYFSCFISLLPRSFPEVTIASEGIFSKIAQAFGYDDIDFESAEFSKNFCVRSRDKKFAYDVCNARMIEYLLANQDLTMEIDADVLALMFDSCLSAAEIESNLERLEKIRSLLPNYLFTNA